MFMSAKVFLSSSVNEKESSLLKEKWSKLLYVNHGVRSLLLRQKVVSKSKNLQVSGTVRVCL